MIAEIINIGVVLSSYYYSLGDFYFGKLANISEVDLEILAIPVTVTKSSLEIWYLVT